MELARIERKTTSRDFRRQETHRLFALLADATGDHYEDLLNEVIVLNTQVAYAVARRFQSRGVPLDDLEQVACVALIRAARAFDPEAAQDFLTYAVPSMTGEIKRYFRDHGWMVRPTRRLQELQARIRRLSGAEEEKRLAPEHVAQVLDVPVEQVVEALSLEGCFSPTSLDMRLAGADGEEGGTTVGDLLVSEGGYDLAEVRVLLGAALACLDERQRQIVQWRFVDDLTQQEIGDRLGVTQMQVSRLIKTILQKLREHVAMDVATSDGVPV